MSLWRTVDGARGGWSTAHRTRLRGQQGGRRGAGIVEYVVVVAAAALTAAGGFTAFGRMQNRKANCLGDAVSKLEVGAPCGDGERREQPVDDGATAPAATGSEPPRPSGGGGGGTLPRLAKQLGRTVQGIVEAASDGGIGPVMYASADVPGQPPAAPANVTDWLTKDTNDKLAKLDKMTDGEIESELAQVLNRRLLMDYLKSLPPPPKDGPPLIWRPSPEEMKRQWDERDRLAKAQAKEVLGKPRGKEVAKAIIKADLEATLDMIKKLPPPPNPNIPQMRARGPATYGDVSNAKAEVKRAESHDFLTGNRNPDAQKRLHEAIRTCYEKVAEYNKANPSNPINAKIHCGHSHPHPHSPHGNEWIYPGDDVRINRPPGPVPVRGK